MYHIQTHISLFPLYPLFLSTYTFFTLLFLHSFLLFLFTHTSCVYIYPRPPIVLTYTFINHSSTSVNAFYDLGCFNLRSRSLSSPVHKFTHPSIHPSMIRSPYFHPGLRHTYQLPSSHSSLLLTSHYSFIQVILTFFSLFSFLSVFLMQYT